MYNTTSFSQNQINLENSGPIAARVLIDPLYIFNEEMAPWHRDGVKIINSWDNSYPGKSFVSKEKVAQEVGVTERSVFNLNRMLKEYGLLTVTKGPGRSSICTPHPFLKAFLNLYYRGNDGKFKEKRISRENLFSLLNSKSIMNYIYSNSTVLYQRDTPLKTNEIGERRSMKQDKKEKKYEKAPLSPFCDRNCQQSTKYGHATSAPFGVENKQNSLKRDYNVAPTKRLYQVYEPNDERKTFSKRSGYSKLTPLSSFMDFVSKLKPPSEN